MNDRKEIQGRIAELEDDFNSIKFEVEQEFSGFVTLNFFDSRLEGGLEYFQEQFYEMKRLVRQMELEKEKL